jgi:hypothetical protein
MLSNLNVYEPLLGYLRSHCGYLAVQIVAAIDWSVGVQKVPEDTRKASPSSGGLLIRSNKTFGTLPA